MNTQELTFNDVPQAISLLIDKVESLQREVAQLRQQQYVPDEKLILGRFHKGEIIFPDDPRLVGLVTKSMIYRRDDNNIPFHKNGGKLYTTPEELEVFFNPHREAMKRIEENTSGRRGGRKPSLRIPEYRGTV